MKYLLPVVILFAVAVSCKKKETNHPSTSVSKGDFLILVVSDSVECALEYREDLFPNTSLEASPVTASAQFNFTTQYYDASIYANGVGIYGSYSINVFGSYYMVDFPTFTEYYLDAFVDSIPGNQLEKHQVYSVPLDTSKIDYLMSSVPEEVGPGWDKIKNLRIVFEYRKKYPDSNIAFLNIVRQNGEEKSYFFMNKYKP